jgi:hypothetical protein
MEWTRIETKWNEMARKLQGTRPVATVTITAPSQDTARPQPVNLPSDATAEGTTLGTRASA